MSFSVLHIFPIRCGWLQKHEIAFFKDYVDKLQEEIKLNGN